MAHLSHPAPIAVTITTEERLFFIELGGRIAQLRKTRGMTQVQLAEALGVSQQTAQAYEAGMRRMPVSTLPLLAKTLEVSLEALFGEEPAKTTRSRRGPVPQWQQHVEAISKLPRAQQRFVTQVLETVLAQQAQH
jgi:transcriptional regulator with XRE-family HTH domain